MLNGDLHINQPRGFRLRSISDPLPKDPWRNDKQNIEKDLANVGRYLQSPYLDSVKKRGNEHE